MNKKMRQINEATNRYVKVQNETLPGIRHIIQNPEEYIDDAQLLTYVSTLYRATLQYIQLVDIITDSDIIKHVRLVDKWLSGRTITLHNSEEIKNRAIEGWVVEPNWSVSSTPALHSEESYEFALMVEEYVGGKREKYAIYMGTKEECMAEHDRLSELRYTEGKPYIQIGNGTRRRNIR